MKAITIPEAEGNYIKYLVGKEDFHLHKNHIIRHVNKAIEDNWAQLTARTPGNIRSIHTYIDLPPDSDILKEIHDEFNANGIIVCFHFCFYIQVDIMLEKYNNSETIRKEILYDAFCSEHGLKGSGNRKRKWYQKIIS